MTKVSTERRNFGVHPAIILTLIREQSGSVNKALAELIMNSIDAGATKIEVTIDDKGFTIIDDGNGFTSRDQLENFFDTFGTPHEANDATFGKFRIGRGQIMSYAKTNWRSCKFEMQVDLKGCYTDLGYDLLIHADDDFKGCRISGEFYEPDKMIAYKPIQDDMLGVLDQCRPFIRTIEYVSVPIFVNGAQINKLPSEQKWDYEDDYAWYKFDKKDLQLNFYNQGVFVEGSSASFYGTGGHIVTKKQLKVNLARNSIIKSDCEVWEHIYETVQKRFFLQVGKVKKLNENEARALLHALLYENQKFDYKTQTNIRNIRFIRDIFNELRSLNDVFTHRCITLYDGKHLMIAERTQREHIAFVIKDDFLRLARATFSEKSLLRILQILNEKLNFRVPFNLIPFSNYVETLNDTSLILKDTELSEEILNTLKILRSISDELAGVFDCNSNGNRRIVAGNSDNIMGWTDGSSYIALSVKLLEQIKLEGGPAKIISVLIHEYCHDDDTSRDHSHDYEFFQRFHDQIISLAFGAFVDKLFRKYVSMLGNQQIYPSGHTRYQVNALSKASLNFVNQRTRTRKKCNYVRLANSSV